MKSETTKISYYNLNELANAAKNEVILDSLYVASKDQIRTLERLLISKNASINILKKNLLSSKNDLKEMHKILNEENHALKKLHKKELRKSKIKKWFWIVPVGVLGYLVGGI